MVFFTKMRDNKGLTFLGNLLHECASLPMDGETLRKELSPTLFSHYAVHNWEAIREINNVRVLLGQPYS